MAALYKAMRMFFQAEDGIRDLVRSRGLVDVYKRQAVMSLGVASVFSNSDTDEVVTADEDVSVLAFWSPQAVAMVVSNTAAATAINFVLVIDVLLTLKACSIVS